MNKPVLDEDKMQRLSFAKYLLAQARIHQTKPYPLSSFAILIIHDLLEIFLQVAIEVHLPQFKKPDAGILLTLGKEINNHLASHNLQTINIQYLKRVNSLRNPLKHSSIFAGDRTVASLYVETEMFFTDFVKILFCIRPDEVNLTALIGHEKIKTHLQEATTFIEQSKPNHAMVALTKAYHYLVHNELVIKDASGFNLMDDDRHAWYGGMMDYRRSSMGGSPLDGNLRQVAQAVSTDVKRIKARLFNLERAVSLGVDYRTFLSFQAHLPHIYLPSTADTEDELRFSNVSNGSIDKLSYSLQQANFCLDFMIDVVFRMQGLENAPLVPSSSSRGLSKFF